MALVRSNCANCGEVELCSAHGRCRSCCPMCHPDTQCEIPLEFIEDPDERGVYLWELPDATD